MEWIATIYIVITSLTTGAMTKFMPFLLVTPQNRIHWYISQSTNQMKQAREIVFENPQAAYTKITKGEHMMTLAVGELRRMNDTSMISYEELFGSFSEQQKILEQIKNEAPTSYTQQITTIKDFGERNKITAKRIFYNGLSPEVLLYHSKNLYTE